MTNRRSDKELRASIMRHALQLIKKLRADGNYRLTFAEDISAIVVEARQLWGKRFINSRIKGEQLVQDASVVGLCLECFKNLADDDGFCQSCNAEADRLEEEIVTEVMFVDFEEMPVKRGKPH